MRDPWVGYWEMQPTLGLVAGRVGSLGKARMWRGWYGFEPEMVKMIQLGVPSAQESCPVEYQCEGGGGSLFTWKQRSRSEEGRWTPKS